MGMAMGWLGQRLARFLAQTTQANATVPSVPSAQLLACLQPGDVLLVEGNSRVSGVIKYLTQSTWSHAALYVGDHLREAGGNPEHCFVDVDMVNGVRSVGMDTYAGLATRICRPVGLNDAQCRRVTGYAIERMGNQYDLRNVFDLARYLFPTPPVPPRFRRRMLEVGSGDPTRAICSTLIAQAFQSIRYPIVPSAVPHTDPASLLEQRLLRFRHYSLFAPSDFDVSPYFQIVKPLLAAGAKGFDFTALRWADSLVADDDETPELPPIGITTAGTPANASRGQGVSSL